MIFAPLVRLRRTPDRRLRLWQSKPRGAGSRTLLVSGETSVRLRELGLVLLSTRLVAMSVPWSNRPSGSKPRQSSFWFRINLKTVPMSSTSLGKYPGLVYIKQAYPPIVPYLRSFHGTLDSWRPSRTKDGFDGRLNAVLSQLRVERSGPKRRRVFM